MDKPREFIHDLNGWADAEQQRYAFRELAKIVLDPKGVEELAICDNNGVVLGYFTPALKRFREEAEAASQSNTKCIDREAFLRGSEPAREVISRAMDQTS